MLLYAQYIKYNCIYRTLEASTRTRSVVSRTSLTALTFRFSFFLQSTSALKRLPYFFARSIISQSTAVSTKQRSPKMNHSTICRCKHEHYSPPTWSKRVSFFFSVLDTKSCFSKTTHCFSVNYELKITHAPIMFKKHCSSTGFFLFISHRLCFSKNNIDDPKIAFKELKRNNLLT